MNKLNANYSKEEINIYKKRIKNISNLLENKKNDAILVSKPSNIFYFSGLKIDNCFLLIIPDKDNYVITDSRFAQEVSFVSNFFSIKVADKSILKSIIKICLDSDIKKILVEADNISIKSFNKLSKGLELIDIIPDSDTIAGLRMIKSGFEIGKIRKSIDILSKVYKRMDSFIKTGITEKELACEIEYIVKRDFKSNFSFSPILACGKSSSFPHAKVTENIVSDFAYLLVDMGVKFDGYCSDLTRIFVLSKMSLEQQKVYQILIEHQKELLDIIKPGVNLAEIDKFSREKLSGLGFEKNIMHSVGHGIGIDVHEAPFVSKNHNYRARKGMVFTIEPAIYFPGKWGIRIEDMILVTDSGFEVLTDSICK